jgi:hypothetical protein
MLQNIWQSFLYLLFFFFFLGSIAFGYLFTTLSYDSWQPLWVQINAAPVMFQPVAVAQGLTAGASYSMLRFDHGSLVPSKGGFLASGTFAERVDFVARTAMHTLDGSVLSQIWSNGTYFYRCVAAA